ncbi:hypothetical protein FSPOR_4238 [Fusarium sporotrichioides]|uniref:Azaphilone pigments biosynthesis cluster protein L N-terminal domain-containing protein n=1 Tax=Fusarium sporotrichioides TaxID=5514 RepID=A0A395SCI3_FUSSP|nr:hypothetical protein FSPOR_4238 [Fusarium sporotrichioides]
MSGPQDIAAIFGLLELGIRSISTLYKFIHELRHIPTKIEQARAEIQALLPFLDEIQLIRATGLPSSIIIRRSGLGEAIAACGKTCSELQALLSTWDPNQSRFTARLKYLRDKETFNDLIKDITTRKQTTILAVAVAQFPMQAESQTKMSLSELSKSRPQIEKQDFVPIAESKRSTQIITCSMAIPPLDTTPLAEYAVPQTIPVEQAPRSATQKNSTTGQVFKAINVGGSSNQIGMSATAMQSMLETKSHTIVQDFQKDITTSDTSNGNQVGIF